MSPDDSTGADSAPGRDGRRDVVVPLRVYKAVTVFSTLFAILSVVAGFALLDDATQRATAPLSQVDPVVALLGVAVIALGAGTYAFSTRFRAAGMRTSKGETDDVGDNG
ncbi:MAG: hypothetical protein ABEJ31_07210 [Haloarculaceae archaeon]